MAFIVTKSAQYIPFILTRQSAFTLLLTVNVWRK
jgi:hypothetical protein